ncbi:hypothetical protein BC826DRAFT_1042921, partial [Russula brevipes]
MNPRAPGTARFKNAQPAIRCINNHPTTFAQLYSLHRPHNTMSDYHLAALTPQNSGYQPECGKNVQMPWQSQARNLDRPTLSGTDPDCGGHPQNLCTSSSSPSDHACEGVADIATAPAACVLPVPNLDVHHRHLGHLRTGEQIPPLPPTTRRPRRRTVLVQDIVVRLLIMSQLETS